MSAVLEALSRLGESPDVVVDTLARLGVSGYRGSTTDCPIATYLRIELPYGRWDVTAADIYDRATASRYVRVPDTIAEVIEGFDAGRYPFLDREEDAAVTA